MEAMWKVVLAVGLLCWSSEGQISCKNEAGVAVDWYILYKAPKSFGFIHIDSTMTGGFQKSSKDINHQDGVLAKTLEPIFTNTPTCGYVAYNDQPPPGKPSAKSRCGHSKGVVMVDKDAVVWLLHSTPKFPESRHSNNFFPDSGKKKAQTFICVTFPVSELNKIEKHLQNIRANIFEYANTDNFSVDIENFHNVWTSDKDLNKQTQIYQDLKSKDNKEFKCFFSMVSDDTEVGDLYVPIAKAVNSNLYAQTWGCQRGRLDSYCPDKGYNVYNVLSVNSNLLSGWKCGSDHSKWCVSEVNDWTCIADSNRAESQSKRPGGALCINNHDVKNAFMMLIDEHKQCPTGGGKRTMSPGTAGQAPKKPRNN